MAYQDAHRPKLMRGQQYIQWTEHHQLAAQGMPPCALHLWQHLLTKYPGGVPQEIELEEVRHEISVGRSKVYSVQSLKNAIAQHLVPKGLLVVVKKFTAKIMRVVANHAGEVKPIEKNIVKPQTSLQPHKQICETEPSNADSAVPSYRELHEDTNKGSVEKDFSLQKAEEIADKYEEKLFQCRIYRKHRPDGKELVDNPKFAPIFKAISSVPLERAERGIQTFLSQARKREYDYPYAALKDAILKGWELD